MVAAATAVSTLFALSAGLAGGLGLAQSAGVEPLPQQNDSKDGCPDLVVRHKSIWSEVRRGRGIESDWTSDAPGHHLGPVLCAVKRARLVKELHRETIRETVAVSTPGDAVPDRRNLQAADADPRLCW